LKTSKEAKEALEIALQGVEGVRMTRPDDPKLTKLKADIRHTIKSDQPEFESEDES
jgi:hypothetical protein